MSKYIGLIIDPICHAPLTECMGFDPTEPLWYPVEYMLPEEIPTPVFTYKAMNEM